MSVKRKISEASEDRSKEEVIQKKQHIDTEEQNGQSDESDEEEEEHKVTKSEATSSQNIHIARETAELFKSNIFKLQIDELLNQVKLNEKHILKMEKVLHKFYDMIQQIPDWEEKTLVEAEAFFENKIVSIPFVDPKPNASSTHYKFNFIKPDVDLIGSFALKMGIYQPQGSNVDVLLTMPKEMFEKKDFLNFRCLHKRSVYLAYFTHHLSLLIKKNKLDHFMALKYTHLNSDPLLPMLTVTCTKNSNGISDEYNFYKTKFSINFIVGFPNGLFDPKKLLPNKNCIRVANSGDVEELPATPLYNFSVLSSTTFSTYLKFLYHNKKQTAAFKDAAILGKIWLQQRNFSSNSAQSGCLGGFGSFEFCILMAALLQGGGVNSNKILLHGFSSYQLFQGTIKYLATMDLCNDGHLQFSSDISTDGGHKHSKYVEEGFQTPTIFDKSRKVNILTKMTVNSYKILKQYAQETLKMLNNVVQDQFANIFLVNINKIDQIKYDLCYDIKLDSDPNLASKFGSMEKIKFITFENFLANKVASILKFALADRVKFMEIELIGRKTEFPITKRKVYANSDGYNFESIRVKLIVDPEESEKLVTKGPAHSQEATSEAIIFKNFWGRKSSLRRFKNGEITHCCIWSPSANAPIVSSIIDYAIRAHISENAKVVSEGTKKLHKCLPLPNLPSSSATSIQNMTSFFNLKSSFDELYKIMFQMQLPLSIKSILPVGSAFRYTSLCHPVPYAYSNPDFLQEVILEFETSPKWPDEIVALEKAKTAFLLKIYDNLMENHSPEYKAFFSRDESIPNNLDITTLNVLTPEGYGFKFRVLSERDEILYLRAISNARNELKPALEQTFLKFTAKYQASIRHTRTIENISHAYPLYSPVVRLFKKWLDKHLLLGHLNDELIELIAIKPFVDPAPYNTPGSLENGFLKVLKFLSQWNWKDEPLILDLVKPDSGLNESQVSESNDEISASTLKKLSDKLTLQQYKTIQSNFTNIRNGDPNGIHLQYFIASKNDPSGILYSSGIPLPIATRLTALAKIATNIISTHGLNKQTIDLLFTPGLKDYDFVVQLKTPTSLKTSSGVIDHSEFKNIANESCSAFPEELDDLSEKMDPTFQLVKYLNLKYSNSIIFSSHRYVGVNGGKNGDCNVITGLIKPMFKKQNKFRVGMDCNVKPNDQENVILNKEAIFHEIAAFGNELITKFESA
ncbi:U3 small nucleolar RNA-associated protein 22 [Nakaseomyces bracarensis]|uniref:U3 small nucleolar RNA-associated protein 22 n=1 Tax=Nakaseomyces bracarensis TaxID=273131 RepID=A0ABR4NR34_9SACH